MRGATTGLFLATLLAGCVGKGKYELAVVQLQATQKALDARDLDARASLERSRTESSSLDAELAGREVQLLAERERYDALDQQLVELAATLASVTSSMPDAPLEPSTGEPPTEGGKVDSVPPGPRTAVLADALARRARGRADAVQSAAHRARVRAAFQPLVDDGYVRVEERRGATVVTLLGAKLFNENRVSLSPLGDELTKRVAVTLDPFPGMQLTVVGHTDDQPVHSTTHPSNWELGFAYAVTFQRGLEFHGFRRTPILVSRADTQPVAMGDGAESRRLNRRVELWIQPNPDVFDAPLPEPDEGSELVEPVEGGSP